MNEKKAPMSKRPKFDGGTMKNILKFLYKSFPVLIPVTALCIILSAAVSAIPSVFIQKTLAIVREHVAAGSLNWEVAKTEILPIVIVLIVLYVVSMLLITLYNQLMVTITQKFLDKLRRRMFNGMQDLSIKYFDTHKHGDIMSHYTNDIDTLRQLVSQSLPAMLQAFVIVLTVFFLMLWYSVWMTLVVIAGVVIMFLITKKIGAARQNTLCVSRSPWVSLKATFRR